LNFNNFGVCGTAQIEKEAEDDLIYESDVNSDDVTNEQLLGQLAVLTILQPLTYFVCF